MNLRPAKPSNHKAKARATKNHIISKFFAISFHSAPLLTIQVTRAPKNTFIMKFTAPTLAALLLVANAASAKETRRLGKKGKSSKKMAGKKGGKVGKSGGDDADATPATPVTSDTVFDTCNNDGTTKFASYGEENSQQLLLREGVIDAIPPSLCGRKGKNVILVVGDGMGWEMTRAGAIAKQVVDELERMNCDTKVGCPDNEAAINAFATRTLSDYYESGKTQFVTCASVVTI
jgi:hypothetical protein